MKTITFTLCLAGALIVFESFYQPKTQSDPTYLTFNVWIEQKGAKLAPSNNIILLDPAPFNIVFEFPAPMGVLLNASFQDKTFKLASKNKPFEKIPGFTETGMAEGLFNEDKEILISKSAPNYWFYDSETEHRFNKVEKSAGGYVCTRIIENLFDTDAKTNTKVIQGRKPLYLVFISRKKGEKDGEMVEAQRMYYTLQWKSKKKS